MKKQHIRIQLGSTSISLSILLLFCSCVENDLEVLSLNSLSEANDSSAQQLMVLPSKKVFSLMFQTPGQPSLKK
jgi:hypothetical protein